MTRVGVLGAGAMGSLFAWALASRTAHEVWLFARAPGFADVAVEGHEPVAVRVTDRPAGPVDLLIVLVKAYATADALRWAEGAVGPETVALTLQNGLGNAEALAAVCGAGRVLAGTTALGATLLGPGRVRLGGLGPTVIAPWGGGAAPGVAPGAASGTAPVTAPVLAAHVAALLNEAGFPTEVRPDPLPLLWGKLAVNCGINALSAILRVPNGELVERPGARRLLEAAAREAAQVAAASGVILDGDSGARAVAVARATAANRSSMLQDVERGRPTEIDAINGA
ncbi:MAG: panE, partial [Firmicutes bacterium]|nr:panE [Bacillota bacterium]